MRLTEEGSRGDAKCWVPTSLGLPHLGRVLLQKDAWNGDKEDNLRDTSVWLTSCL